MAWAFGCAGGVEGIRDILWCGVLDGIEDTFGVAWEDDWQPWAP